jgi:mannose-6-phosphate isomerase-like protein (cupin superfamily)
MKISNIQHCLDNSLTDQKVGVKLAFLTGDENMSMFAIELAGGHCIPAHYHKEGIETYYILEGQGVIITGIIRDNTLRWNAECLVNAGDCFTIYPGEVHEFRNVSEGPLRIIASAPLNHIQNDRYFLQT